MGPRLYVGGELRLGDPSVTITAPQPNQVFKVDQPIPLNASVDGGIKLSLYTGLDLKAGIAGLEVESECGCIGTNCSTSDIPSQPRIAHPSGIPCNCSAYYRRDGLDERQTSLPPLPRQHSCYRHDENQARAKCYSGGPFESHHIIQEAAVRGVKGYPRSSSKVAPTVLLDVSSHQRANNAQPTRPAGTFATEKALAVDVLLASQALQISEIQAQMSCVDNFFMGILGYTNDTETKAVR